MDLVTLIAACALRVDPKLMHALIWHQSGGEPWSFSVPGERQPQVYRSPREAAVEAHRSAPAGLPIRIGLTGLAVDSGTATLAMLMPCPNISIAAQHIMRLSDRCEAVPRFKANLMHCAIAAYHGSWGQPDDKFADAVLTSVAKGDAPNFDMPDEIGDRSNEVAAGPSVAGQRTSTPRSAAREDQRQGWSSALFPVRPKPFTSTSSSGGDADRLQEPGTSGAHSMAAPSHGDGPFVHRSLSGGRNERIEPASHLFAWWRGFGRKARGRRPTDRRMAG
jgi:hypothetical protein